MVNTALGRDQQSAHPKTHLKPSLGPLPAPLRGLQLGLLPMIMTMGLNYTFPKFPGGSPNPQHLRM